MCVYVYRSYRRTFVFYLKKTIQCPPKSHVCLFCLIRSVGLEAQGLLLERLNKKG